MKIKLELDNEEVPLNRFVTKVLTNIMEGIVNELKGVEEDWNELNMKIEK